MKDEDRTGAKYQSMTEIFDVGKSRIEQYHFGEASVTVDEIDVNVWKCSVDGSIIGFVKYNSSGWAETNPKKKKGFDFCAFCTPDLRDAELYPATSVNKYNSLRSAVQAVVACHYNKKQYTYISNPIAILDGVVVSETVYKQRVIIKPSLVK